MTSQQFGQLALQLLSASQIPGEALDTALAFRETAKALTEGRMTLAEVPADQPKEEPLK